MSEPDSAIRQDELALSELIEQNAITVDSFTANPSQTPPCGGPGVTLNWAISRHADRAGSVDLRRNLASVRFHLTPFFGDLALRGARLVQPIQTSEYSLLASLRQVSGTLRSLVVTVDYSGCIRTTLAESTLNDLVAIGIQTLLQEFRQSSGIDAQVRSSRITIDPGGIVLSLQFHIRRGEEEADVSVGSRYQVFVQDCKPFIINPGWNIDADVGFLGNLFDLDDAVADEITNVLRPLLLSAFQQQFGSAIPSGYCFCSARPSPGQLDITLCSSTRTRTPAGGGSPTA